MIEKYHYKKITSGERLSITEYRTKLKNNYNCDFIKFSNKNKSGENFIIFLDYLTPLVEKYKQTTIKSMKLRDSSINEYFKNFLVSEINGTLNIEGINSSRRLVNNIISKNEKEINLTPNEKESLVLNMNECMKYIMLTNEIKETNIFVLYNLFIKNIDMGGNKIENHGFYREDNVQVGSDFGIDSKFIKNEMHELMKFINSTKFNNIPIVKALICHYLFEHIHPYYDFNGRMGRMVHLWILKKINIEYLWENIYLSESINSFKDKYYKAFNKMKSANKLQKNGEDLNIDLTLWVSYLLEIFIEHNNIYIQMKEMVKLSKVPMNQKERLFLMDILLKNNKNPGFWFTRKLFKKKYHHYSNTIADRVFTNLRDSGLFIERGKKEIELRLLMKV